jgi:hypothetical protein
MRVKKQYHQGEWTDEEINERFEKGAKADMAYQYIKGFYTRWRDPRRLPLYSLKRKNLLPVYRQVYDVPLIRNGGLTQSAASSSRTTGRATSSSTD